MGSRLAYDVMMPLRLPSLLFVAGVAALTLLRNAHASDTDWHRLITPHFELYTDLDTQTAVEAANELERTRDALITAAWPTFRFPDVVRTQVFVLRNGIDFERYFGARVGGLFAGGTRPAFFLHGPPSRWAPRVRLDQAAPSSILRHEMTHQLAAAVFPRTPQWFGEGLAQFLETVQITADGTTVVVGSTNGDARAMYRAHRTVTLRRMLEWDEWIDDLPDSEVRGLYGTSWAFFHWLYNNHQEPFARYQIALSKGINPKKAWNDAFAGFNPDAYDPVLFAYVEHGQGAVDRLPLRTSAPKIDVIALSAADAHAVRARIALTGASGIKDDGVRKARQKAADAELQRALALDLTSVEALLLTTTMTYHDLTEVVRAAAAAHPDDSRIHARLGDLLTDRGEREAAYRRALKIDRDNPEVLDALAWVLLMSRRTEEALVLALRAVSRAPHDPGAHETLAEALMRRGRCQAALQQQRRALDRVTEASSRAAPIRERLQTMKAACKVPQDWDESAASPSSGDGTQASDENSRTGSNRFDARIRPHHEGVFASGSVGLGYGGGSYESSQSQLTTPNSSFGGGGLDIAGALGYGVARGFVLALEGGIFSHPSFSEQINYSNGAFVTDITTFRVGVVTDIHPSLSSPWHLQAGLDVIRGSWNGSAGEEPYGPRLPIDEVSVGWFTHVSAGMAWRVHTYELGPSLRFHYANLGSEHTDATLSGVTALLGFFL